MSIANEVLARLQRHYINPSQPFPGGVFLPEVSLGNRRADALYVGFTTSSGKHLIGHEIKVSRSDWLHELDQPEKAEAWISNCHEWYLVVPGDGIVRPEELPIAWGLMMPSKRSKNRMEIVVRSRVREVEPSWEAVHEILKKIDTMRAGAFDSGKRAGTEAARKLWQSTVEERVDSQAGVHKENAERLQKILDEISEAIGLEVTSYGGREGISVKELCGSLARYVRADRDAERALNMRYNGIRRAADQLSSAIAALDAAGAVMDS